MNKLMLITVRLTRQLDNGAFKRVKEQYLVSALSFTEAEARIYEELGSVVKGEFSVSAISRYEVQDVIRYEAGERLYKIAVKYDDIDSVSDRSKTVKQAFLVEASSVDQATDILTNYLKAYVSDCTITGVNLTTIVDVLG